MFVALLIFLQFQFSLCTEVHKIHQLGNAHYLKLNKIYKMFYKNGSVFTT